MSLRTFASDNAAGVHPDVLAALLAANEGHALAYGDDDLTRRAEARFGEVFGADASVFFVQGGTAANVLALSAALRPYEAVICAASAHVHTDECGALERFSGSKVLAVPAPDGKLTPALVDEVAGAGPDQHHVQPAIVSISQSTELGTVYSTKEISVLAEHARQRGFRLHLDGARIANAAAALGIGLREASRDLGVDLLSFGGTKNGAMAAEAVVIFDPELERGFRYIRMQGMQTASKMRYVAAQLEALLTDELWLRNAEHANAMARRLATAAAGLAGIQIVHPVEANAVFAVCPPAATTSLQARFPFHVWDERHQVVRWMCAWDTTQEDVDSFVAAMREIIATPR
jgi:threonine aldolase